MSGELLTELKTQTLEKASSVSLGQANAPSNTQAELQNAIWTMCVALIAVAVLLNKARGELNLASIDAGFKSANETAKAGLFQLGGGTILAGTGVAQDVAGGEASGALAKVKGVRDSTMAEINENTMIPEENCVTEPKSSLSAEKVEGSDITVQVEALEEEPSSAALGETEEEVFYDAEEEVQSCKKTEPEEQTEEARMVEQANAQGKMTHREADKLIRRANREYEVNKDIIQAKAIRGMGEFGQGAYAITQGLAEQKKSESQKDTIEQQTKENAQAQQEKTTDGLNKEIDRLKDFDAFRSNSSSLKG